MINKVQLKSKKINISNLLDYSRQTIFIFLLLLNTQIYAQQEIKPRSFGIQAGINKGILDNVSGPSFSLHYAIRSDKVLQLESMIFFDRSYGRSFLSGDSQKSLALGLVGGIRINLLPKRNWNPSFLVLPGFIYSSEINSSSGRHRALSGTLCLAFSNTFYKRHMLSLGVNPGEYNTITYVKYGFCFW